MHSTSGCSSDVQSLGHQRDFMVLTNKSRPPAFVSMLAALAWVAAVNAASDPLPANPTPLNQLNTQSAQQLREMQQPKSLYPPGALRPSAAQASARQGLDQQQQTEQRLLQERQRHEFLWRNRRPATIPGPGVQPDPGAINQQWQFQLQQQRQLDLFRMQQGWPGR